KAQSKSLRARALARKEPGQQNGQGLQVTLAHRTVLRPQRKFPPPRVSRRSRAPSTAPWVDRTLGRPHPGSTAPWVDRTLGAVAPRVDCTLGWVARGQSATAGSVRGQRVGCGFSSEIPSFFRISRAKWALTKV